MFFPGQTMIITTEALIITIHDAPQANNSRAHRGISKN